MLDKLPRDPRTNAPRPGFIAMELEDIGVSGLITMLQKGSALSGRGEHATPEDALRHALDQEKKRADRERRSVKDTAVEKFKALRKRINKEPVLPGADLHG